MNTEEVTVERVDPGLLLMQKNIRFGLKDTRIESLVKSIQELGEVRTPLRVSALPKPIDGKLYLVNEGHYRTAAALRVKELDGFKDFTVPIQLEEMPDDLTRLKHQISENMDRENLSPLDTGIAIKELLDANVPRMEIRMMFARPGGRKGMKNEPVSNSFLNIHTQFLEFPKNIQEKIHDGRITVGGAMQLARSKREDWPRIVEQLEEDRLTEISRQEREDEKSANEEKRLASAQEKVEDTSKAAEEAKKALEAADQLVKEKNAAAMEAYKATKLVPEPTTKTTEEEIKAIAEAKVKAQEAFRVAEADAKGAMKKLEEARKEAAKQEALTEKARELAQKQAEKLRQQREAKSAKSFKKTAAGADKVKAAAKKVGAESKGPVGLNAAEIRAAIGEMCDEKKVKYPMVRKIAEVMKLLISGAQTSRQAAKMLAVMVTGEETSPANPKGKAAETAK